MVLLARDEGTAVSSFDMFFAGVEGIFPIPRELSLGIVHILQYLNIAMVEIAD